MYLTVLKVVDFGHLTFGGAWKAGLQASCCDDTLISSKIMEKTVHRSYIECRRDVFLPVRVWSGYVNTKRNLEMILIELRMKMYELKEIIRKRKVVNETENIHKHIEHELVKEK